MIRPVTAICMLAAGASGLFLYQTKHRAVMLDRQIMAVLKQTDATRDRIRTMQAEWALLNEPDRLAELSGKHLGLRTLSPTQFVSVADLGSRLPPPDAPGTSYSPGEDVPQVPVAAVVAPVVTTAAVSAPHVAARAVPAQVPAAAAPAQVAAAAPVRPPAPPRPAQVASLPSPSPVPAPHAAPPVVNVAAAPIKVAHPAPAAAEAVAAHAAPARAPVAQAAWTPAPASPAPANPAPAPAYQAARYATAEYAAPAQPALPQSALGGVRPSLPPPVPYGTQPR